jgi:hypothetical protein
MAAYLEGVPLMSDTVRGFITSVRMYMRDHPELNRLIKGQETSDRMIAFAAMIALSHFNGTPPVLGDFSYDYLLPRYYYILLPLTVTKVIESVGLLQTRNHLNYSDGGQSVGVNDKTPLLMNWLNYFRSWVIEELGRVKVSMNIEQAMTSYGVHTELWYINGLYFGY